MNTKINKLLIDDGTGNPTRNYCHSLVEQLTNKGYNAKTKSFNSKPVVSIQTTVHGVKYDIWIVHTSTILELLRQGSLYLEDDQGNIII